MTIKELERAKIDAEGYWYLIGLHTNHNDPKYIKAMKDAQSAREAWIKALREIQQDKTTELSPPSPQDKDPKAE